MNPYMKQLQLGTKIVLRVLLDGGKGGRLDAKIKVLWYNRRQLLVVVIVVATLGRRQGLRRPPGLLTRRRRRPSLGLAEELVQTAMDDGFGIVDDQTEGLKREICHENSLRTIKKTLTSIDSGPWAKSEASRVTSKLTSPRQGRILFRFSSDWRRELQCLSILA